MISWTGGAVDNQKTERRLCDGISPDGVVGGSKDMDSAAVWSRHDPVPGIISGYGVDEIPCPPEIRRSRRR